MMHQGEEKEQAWIARLTAEEQAQLRWRLICTMLFLEEDGPSRWTARTHSLLLACKRAMGRDQVAQMPWGLTH